MSIKTPGARTPTIDEECVCSQELADKCGAHAVAVYGHLQGNFNVLRRGGAVGFFTIVTKYWDFFLSGELLESCDEY